MYVHIILYLMYVYICVHIWVHILHVYMYIYIDKYIYMYMYHTYIYVCRYMRMIVASYKDRSKPRFCPPGSARGSHIFACMKLHFRVWQRILIEFEIGWSKPQTMWGICHWQFDYVPLWTCLSKFYDKIDRAVELKYFGMCFRLQSA